MQSNIRGTLRTCALACVAVVCLMPAVARAQGPVDESVPPAENTSGEPGQPTVTADPSQPETSIESGPAGPINSTSATFAFGSSDADSSFECKLDGPSRATGVWQPCSSPKTLTGLADGVYSFLVRATDGLGTVDGTPARRSFKVDTKPPTTVFTAEPTGETTGPTATFRFSGSEPGVSYSCRLARHGAWTWVWVPCSSPLSLSPPDGTYDLWVKATDEAGNTEVAPLAKGFTIDAHAPPALRVSGFGAWCWFNDPRALYVNGTTYLAYVDTNGNEVVAARGVYNTPPQRIGWEIRDDHDNPALVRYPDGRVLAYYAGHNGAGLHWREMLTPDARHWGPERTFRSEGGHNYTYAYPVWLRKEHRAFMFWRQHDGAAYRTMFSSSTLPSAAVSAVHPRASSDSHWAAARALLTRPGQRPYMKLDASADRIALAFTDGNPNEGLTSLFYAEYHDGSLWTAGGRRIGKMGRAISPWSAEHVYNAYSHAKTKAWVWDVALGRDHHPVIAYVTFPPDGSHQYWWARFDGRRWTSHQVPFGSGTITTDLHEIHYSGGMSLDHRDPRVLFASVRVAGRDEIVQLRTDNQGRQWSSRWITQDSALQNVRPVVPSGLPPGKEQVFWLRGLYNNYLDFRTSVVGIG